MTGLAASSLRDQEAKLKSCAAAWPSPAGELAGAGSLPEGLQAARVPTPAPRAMNWRRLRRLRDRRTWDGVGIAWFLSGGGFGRSDDGQPLTAPAVRPPTRKRWSAMNPMTTGSETTSDAAMSSGHAVEASPMNVLTRPGGR